jgi:hypothetical protein
MWHENKHELWYKNKIEWLLLYKVKSGYNELVVHVETHIGSSKKVLW